MNYTICEKDDYFRYVEIVGFSSTSFIIGIILAKCLCFR